MKFYLFYNQPPKFHVAQTKIQIIPIQLIHLIHLLTLSIFPKKKLTTKATP